MAFYQTREQPLGSDYGRSPGHPQVGAVLQSSINHLQPPILQVSLCAHQRVAEKISFPETSPTS